ncbi:MULTISPECIES: hypothetical protein [Aerosakkonema]|uniref:hypothetical protein n=1 Tax=Aerosakkonema TaxID=1246629 RepID=UPI0035BA7073
MFISTSSDEGASDLAELIRFSRKVTTSKPARTSRWQRVNQIENEASATLSTESSATLDGCTPSLTSLREGDTKALAALFDREDSDEIETDISKYLLLLWPEPCWEDNPFDFLREYL